MSTNNMTIMFWLRLSDVQVEEYNTYYALIDGWNTDQPAWLLLGRNFDYPTPAVPAIQFEIFDGNDAWEEFVNYVDLQSANAIGVDEWHHYAYTKDGDAHKLYVDAVECANAILVQPENTNSWANGYEFFGAVGGLPEAPAFPFAYEGKWIGARFRMWTRTLTANEIWTEAQSNSAVNSVALWRDIAFETANGADASAANNYLVLTGNVSVWPAANTQDVEFLDWG